VTKPTLFRTSFYISLPNPNKPRSSEASEASEAGEAGEADEASEGQTVSPFPRTLFFRLVLVVGFFFCGCEKTDSLQHAKNQPDPVPRFEKPVQAPVAGNLPQDLVAELVKKHGDAQRPRIERGLRQVAALWRSSDGNLAEFAREHFVADETQLENHVLRLQTAFEELDGHTNEMVRELKRPLDTDEGPLSPLDKLLGSVDPSVHVIEDLFQSKVGFWVLLNLPLTDLNQRISDGEKWSRKTWAQVRLTQRFSRRIPPDIQQKVTDSVVAGERYIASYNLYLHHLLDDKNRRLFPKGLRLISHWNLRDEIRAAYSAQEPLAKQRTIQKAMQRIVDQSIPLAVIDDPRVDWNPFTNEVRLSPKEEIEPGQKTTPLPSPLSVREPDTRYAMLLSQARAQRLFDPYSPQEKTLIERSFQRSREIPEPEVVRALIEICSSPLIKQLGVLAEKQLGRKLEAHDLWYAGFRPRSRFSEEKLDEITRKRYPSRAAFEADLPAILEKLSFTPLRAKFLAEHIRVDAARGAGHAMQAMRRGDFPRLRTRIGPQGMDYKGYNIAIHELGHNVEQVFSLYEVGDTLLAGVPNNAFTEALAFVFQKRDIELLDLGKPDPETDRRRILAEFWETWEIAGVALVDIATWHYLYDHPDATPSALREEVVRLSKEVWNRYYADVLHEKDSTLLGIYSHMIQNTLYLPDYPLGHLIAAQLEEHFAKQPPGSLGQEFERVAKMGQVTPDLWLKHATGKGLSTAALLRMTEAALRTEK
jgi:hypothetical protein